MEIEPIATEFFDWLKENREVANDFPQATKAYFQPVSFPTSDWWKTNSKLIPEKFHQFLKVVFTYCDYYAPFEDVTIKTPSWNTVKDMTNEEETNAVGRFLTRASCDDKIMKFELTGKTHKLYQWNWTAFRHGFYEPMSAWGYEDPSSKKITYILMTNTCRGFDTLETRLRNELLSARFTPKITNIITRIRRLDENTVNANRAKRSNARVKAMFQFGEKQENLADAVKDLIPTLEAVIKDVQANESNRKTLDKASTKLTKVIEHLFEVQTNTFCGNTAKQTRERLHVDITRTMPPREKKKGKK